MLIKEGNASYLCMAEEKRVKYNLVGVYRDFYIYFFKANKFIFYKYGIEINHICTKRGFKINKI